MDEDDSYQRRKRVKVDLINMSEIQSPVLSAGKVRWENDSYDANNELQEIEKQKKQLESFNQLLLKDQPNHGILIKQYPFLIIKNMFTLSVKANFLNHNKICISNKLKDNKLIEKMLQQRQNEYMYFSQYTSFLSLSRILQMECL